MAAGNVRCFHAVTVSADISVVPFPVVHLFSGPHPVVEGDPTGDEVGIIKDLRFRKDNGFFGRNDGPQSLKVEADSCEAFQKLVDPEEGGALVKMCPDPPSQSFFRQGFEVILTGDENTLAVDKDGVGVLVMSGVFDPGGGAPLVESQKDVDLPLLGGGEYVHFPFERAVQKCGKLFGGKAQHRGRLRINDNGGVSGGEGKGFFARLEDPRRAFTHMRRIRNGGTAKGCKCHGC